MAKNNLSVLISVLQDQPVAFRPDIARIAGSATAGIFLCQLMYWEGKGKNVTGEVYKTSAEWEAETSLTLEEQMTARRNLRGRNLIIERRGGAGGYRNVLLYRVNWEALIAALEGLYSAQNMGKAQVLNDTQNLGKTQVKTWAKPKVKLGLSRVLSITENTSKITSENAPKSGFTERTKAWIAHFEATGEHHPSALKNQAYLRIYGLKGE